MNTPFKKQAKQPWEKDLSELTKYDWSIAVGLHPKHKNCPLDLRVTNVVMQKADSDTGLMWATQQSIARLAGVADERQVRTAMQRLGASGAISKKRIADLQPDTFEALGNKMSGNRNKRGVVYTIKLFWALETFEAYVKRPLAEPVHLRKMREGHRTTIVRSGQDYDSPAYTTYQNYNDTEGGHEGKKLIKVSSIPPSTYSLLKGGDPDQPFPIPANDDEGHAILDGLPAGREVVDAVRDYFHRKLMHGELTLAMLVEYRRVSA